MSVSMVVGHYLRVEMNRQGLPSIKVLADLSEMGSEELKEFLEKKQVTGKKFPMYRLKQLSEPPKTDLWFEGEKVIEASTQFIEFSSSKGTRRNQRAFGTYAWALKIRSDLLKRIALFILEVQKEFFSGGALHAVNRSNCARQLEIDVSLVSRCIKNKKIEIAGQIYELSFFFSTQWIHPETVRGWIREKLQKEEKTKPFSDEALAKMWNQDHPEQKVARKTMQKYRKNLCIPPSHLRKIS